MVSNRRQYSIRRLPRLPAAVPFAARVHARRVAGRDRDHRRAAGAVAAGGAVDARGGPAARCVRNNLRQIGIGMLDHHNAQHHFPAGLTDRRTATNPNGRQLAWSIFLLPYIEEHERLAVVQYESGVCRPGQSAGHDANRADLHLPQHGPLGAYRVGDLTGERRAQPRPPTGWAAPTTAACSAGRAPDTRS